MKLLSLVNPEVSWHAESLAGALGQMAVFALAGVILLVACFKIFDRAITRVDLETEIARGNVAAGILGGSIIIALSIILAVAML